MSHHLTIQDIYTLLISAARERQARVPFMGRWEDRPWQFLLIGRRELIEMDGLVYDGRRDIFEVLAEDFRTLAWPTGRQSQFEIVDEPPFST